MKKLFVLAFALTVFGSLSAQDYKPFQLYIGVGYAVPSNGGAGVLFDLEPAYRVSDAFAIGLRWESAGLAKEDLDGLELGVSALQSYTINGKYYLSSEGFRPYVGAGIGVFSTASVNVGVGSSTLEIGGGSKIGFYPRIGFDSGHFNINIDYNIVGDGNSYLGIRIGAFIFGGKS
jgi:hypothetical protein